MANNLSTKLLDVIARSWTDDDYRTRLLANPNSVLAEDGIEAPNGASVRVIDQQPNEISQSDADRYDMKAFCSPITVGGKPGSA